MKTLFHIIGKSCFYNRDGSQICQTSRKVTSHKCTVPCTVIFPIYILSASNETVFLHFFLYLIEIKHAFSVLYLETIFECMILLLWSNLVKVNSTLKWFEIQRSLMRFFFTHCKYKFSLTVGCCVLYLVLYFADCGASSQSVQLWFPSPKSRG